MQGGDVPFHCIPESQALVPLRSLNLFCSSASLDSNASLKKTPSVAPGNFVTRLVGDVGFPHPSSKSGPSADLKVAKKRAPISQKMGWRASRNFVGLSALYRERGREPGPRFRSAAGSSMTELGRGSVKVAKFQKKSYFSQRHTAVRLRLSSIILYIPEYKRGRSSYERGADRTPLGGDTGG